MLFGASLLMQMHMCDHTCMHTHACTHMHAHTHDSQTSPAVQGLEGKQNTFNALSNITVTQEHNISFSSPHQGLMMACRSLCSQTAVPQIQQKMMTIRVKSEACQGQKRYECLSF